jgi:hypothetical protein
MVSLSLHAIDLSSEAIKITALDKARFLVQKVFWKLVLESHGMVYIYSCFEYFSIYIIHVYLLGFTFLSSAYYYSSVDSNHILYDHAAQILATLHRRSNK